MNGVQGISTHGNAISYENNFGMNGMSQLATGIGGSSYVPKTKLPVPDSTKQKQILNRKNIHLANAHIITALIFPQNIYS